MATIARVFVRARQTDTSVQFLRAVGEAAYRATESAEAKLIPLPGLGSRVEVREGSVEVIAEILADVGKLIVAIAAYGGFWQGLDYIRQHARIAAEYIRDGVKADPVLSDSPVTATRVTMGQITSLERLKRQVDEGSLDRDEGVQSALRILSAGEEPLTDDVIASLELAFRAQKVGAQRLAQLEPEQMVAHHAVSGQVLRDTFLLPDRQRVRRKRRLLIERPPDSKKRKVTIEE